MPRFISYPSYASAALRFPIIVRRDRSDSRRRSDRRCPSGEFCVAFVAANCGSGDMVVVLPSDLRVVPFLPLTVERLGLVICGLWFVNLVNFMDGLDWMTVAEIVPVSGALSTIGLFGFLPPLATVVSLALCGAMLGFAYFNRPIAKLFLGDVGSLPMGLVLGWLLVLLAGNGAPMAAVLLPLYYLADSTITLVRRCTKCRDDLAGTSLAFLSARYRPWLYSYRRGDTRFRHQYCAGSVRDLDRDSEIAHHRYCRAHPWRRPCSRPAVRAVARPQ